MIILILAIEELSLLSNMAKKTEVKNKLSEWREVLVSFFLRSGLAMVFFYAATSAYLNP